MRNDDDNPARGVLNGIVLGAIVWAMAIGVFIATHHAAQQRHLGPTDRMYVCAPHAACQRVSA